MSMNDIQTNARKDNTDDEIQIKEKQDIRRETRRRKILENAKNRLDKLNGHVTSSYNKNKMGQNINLTPPCEYSDPEVEPDIKANILSTENINGNFNVNAFEANNIINALAGDIFNATSTRTEAATVALVNQQRHYLLTYRIHIIFCALAALITAIIWPMSSNGFHIFIYSGSFVLIDLIFFRSKDNLNPIFQLVSTMLGINVQHANIVLHIFSIIQSLVIDLSVFIFAFCSFICILFSINNEFVDVKLN